MKCAACGASNRKKVAFCTSCGAALEKAEPRRRPPNARRSGNSNKAIVGLIVGAVVVGFVVMLVGRGGSGQDAAVGPAFASPAFAAEVQEVAAQFWCGCGSCQEPELADCTCPTAVEEKQLIDRELRKGAPRSEVIRTVYRRYGKIKSQYAALVREEGETVSTDESTAVPEIVAADDSVESLPVIEDAQQVAVAADTLAIARRFTCACGQCGDMNLADCTCDHARGAREMKAFIAYKVSQKRHVVGEIVDAVAYEYGHLIEE